MDSGSSPQICPFTIQCMKPWWQLPSWTRSNDCGNVCLLLLGLNKRHPEACSLNLLSIIARHVAPCLRPPALLAVISKSGWHVIGEKGGAERVSIPFPFVNKSELLEYAPTGDCVAVGTEGTVHLFDIYAGKLVMQCYVGDHEVCSLAVSPIGSYLAAGLRCGTVDLVDTEVGTVQRSLLLNRPVGSHFVNTEGAVVSMVYSKSGTRLAAMVCWEFPGEEDDAGLVWDGVMEYFVHVVDVQAGSVLWMESCSIGGALCHVDYSPAGSVVAFSNDDGEVFLADAETSARLPFTGLCDHDVCSLTFSPNGSHLAIGEDEGCFYLVNMAIVKSGNDEGMVEFREFGGGYGFIHSLAFSQNGLCLALGMGCTIRILDTETCSEIQSLQLSDNKFIYRCFYLPDSDAQCIGQRRSFTAFDENVGKETCVIQPVAHPLTDPARHIPPSEAAQTQQELWASGIEASLSRATTHPKLLLLTFARHTQTLEQALLASALANEVAWCVQPNWANGAKIFVDMEESCALTILPPGLALRPWHACVSRRG